jgi:hypothetical protein
MNRATCNRIVQRGLANALAALAAGNQSAVRLAVAGVHLAVMENFLAEMEEEIIAEDRERRASLQDQAGARRVERETRSMEAARLIDQAEEVIW